MQKHKRGLTLLLSAALLFSALPIGVLAADELFPSAAIGTVQGEESNSETVPSQRWDTFVAGSEESEGAATPLAGNEIAYNTGSMPVVVGDDPVQAEEDFGYVLFQEDGSYTIELPEVNPLFPYEIQFSYQGKTESRWFDTIEDTVTIEGHTFSLSAEGEPSSIGVWVGDDYVTAYPEPKEFTDGGGISAFSLLPLETKRLNLDLTDYLPSEIKSVKLNAVLKDYTIPEGAAVMWAKSQGNYASDDFVIANPDTEIDLTAQYYRSNRYKLILLVGTADQLEMSNTRYEVTVTVCDMNSLFEFEAYTTDTQRRKLPIYNDETMYYNYGDAQRNSRYYIMADQKERAANADVYLGMKFGSLFESDGLQVTVYDGYYTSQTELPQNKDITSAVWNPANLAVSGGFKGKYGFSPDSRQAFTVVMKRGAQIVEILPFFLYMGDSMIDVDISSSLYAKGSGSEYHGVSARETYTEEEDIRVTTFLLNAGYSAKNTYYIDCYLYNAKNPSGAALDSVRAAYVGIYNSLAEAAGQPDIKDKLFTSVYDGGGYGADFSGGVSFTVFDIEGGVHHLKAVVEESDYVDDRTGFWVDGARPLEPADASDYPSFSLASDNDSYYENGFQVVFLLNSDGSPVDAEKIVPSFSVDSEARIYAGTSTASGVLQESGKTSVPFLSGQPVAYTAAAEDGRTMRNYWVTFVTQQQGAKLFVNGTNVDSLKQNGVAVREIFFSQYYDGDHHDVFFANIGDEELRDLKVTLSADAQHIKLDDYWTVQEDGVRTLAAFTADSRKMPNGSTASGYANNTAKVRLLPDGEGLISGILTISSSNGGSVSIKLTGFAGDPQITTTEIVDGVKWVPYSSMIQTNYMYGGSDIQFSLVDGTLPDGIVVKPNGEIYGVPQETGEFPFTVQASMSVNSAVRGRLGWEATASYILTIAENTHTNVWNATDTNYDITIAIPNQDGTKTIPEMNLADNSWRNRTQVMLTQGEYDYFVDLWLDGRKLVEGVDYEKEPGSTRITVLTSVLGGLSRGIHTIAAEFREGDREAGALKRAAQNYVLGISGSGSSNGGSSGSDSSGGGSSGAGSSGNSSGSSSGTKTPGKRLSISGKASQPQIPGKRPTTPEGVALVEDGQTQYLEYTVVAGDCLWTIAERFLGAGWRWTELVELNRDVVIGESLIYPGQKLLIPIEEKTAPAAAEPMGEYEEYTVAAGDCLWAISDRFLGAGWKWRELYVLNQDIIPSDGFIYPGQKLRVPRR